jgi:hypothetical protein
VASKSCWRKPLTASAATRGCRRRLQAHDFRRREDRRAHADERAINEAEDVIVRRRFREFADDRSPRAVARDLNLDGVPGPRGDLWMDATIAATSTAARGSSTALCRPAGVVPAPLWLRELAQIRTCERRMAARLRRLLCANWHRNLSLVAGARNHLCRTVVTWSRAASPL